METDLPEYCLSMEELISEGRLLHGYWPAVRNRIANPFLSQEEVDEELPDKKLQFAVRTPRG
jgi:hypothetical protein